MSSSQSENEPTPGAALRAAREAAGRSVEQVSADTRIRVVVLHDLEADNFRSCGGSFYARGHMKSIARSLGVDPAPLLELFDEAQEPAGLPVVLDVDPLAQPVTAFGGSAFPGVPAGLTPERRGPRWGVALAGAGVVVLAITAIGYLDRPSSPSAPATQANRAVPTSTPRPTRAAVRTPDPRAVASKPPVTGAQLRVRLINGDSWVSISNPTGTTLFAGVLRSGQFKDFSDPTRLKVVVGNAVAVNLNCGGRDNGPAGASGAVRHFSCTSAGLQSL